MARELLCVIHAVESKDGGGESFEKARERNLTEAVLSYLREHPQAMDTLEGIAEWWIPRAQLRADVTLLARILDRLSKQGFLEEVGTGGDRRYRLRREPEE